MEFSLNFALAAVVVFLATVGIFSFIFKGSDLEEISALQGENLLFEENVSKVEHGGVVKGAVFINCKVRVTSLRIIIAQKKLLSRGWSVKHVIKYSSNSEGAVTGKNYYTAHLDKSHIRFEYEPGKEQRTVVVIEIPYARGVRGQYIRFITSKREEFEKYFTA